LRPLRHWLKKMDGVGAPISIPVCLWVAVALAAGVFTFSSQVFIGERRSGRPPDHRTDGTDTAMHAGLR
jgi:hypothetical protein